MVLRSAATAAVGSSASAPPCSAAAAVPSLTSDLKDGQGQERQLQQQQQQQRRRLQQEQQRLRQHEKLRPSLLAGVGSPEEASPTLSRLIETAGIGSLEEAAPGVRIVPVQTAEEAAAEAADAQALIGFCSEEILAQAPKLHWIQVYSSGVDRCVLNPSLHEGDKLLTNGQRIASPALAEHAIAMMMTLVRGLDVYHRNQMQGQP